jgi:hypothetical protein
LRGVVGFVDLVESPAANLLSFLGVVVAFSGRTQMLDLGDEVRWAA